MIDHPIGDADIQVAILKELARQPDGVMTIQSLCQHVIEDLGGVIDTESAASLSRLLTDLQNDQRDNFCLTSNALAEFVPNRHGWRITDRGRAMISNND